MKIEISISTKAEAILRVRSRACGRTMEEYIASVVEQVASSSNMDHPLAGFRKQVAESGMSDEEFDQFFETLCGKAFHERSLKKRAV